MNYTFQFGILWDYGPYLAWGLWHAWWTSLPSIVFSTVLGLMLAAMSLSRNRGVRFASVVFVDLFRTLPVVVLLIWIHYVMPILTGLNLSPTGSSILALSLNGAALACEAFRGGLEAIPPTQQQAAQSPSRRVSALFGTFLQSYLAFLYDRRSYLVLLLGCGLETEFFRAIMIFAFSQVLLGSMIFGCENKNSVS